MTNLQIVMNVPIQKKLPVNVPLHGAGPGAMEKESTQWKYIICLLLNIRTMNDFKHVFLYSQSPKNLLRLVCSYLRVQNGKG